MTIYESLGVLFVRPIIFMFLWNYYDYLHNMPTLGYWESVGVMYLASLFFPYKYQTYRGH